MDEGNNQHDQPGIKVTTPLELERTDCEWSHKELK